MKKKLTIEQLKKKLNVTIDGKVTRAYDDYIYAECVTNSGYNRTTEDYTHRLVAIFHIPNPNNLPCVNHIDGNKLNNNVTNLEWCSYSDNGKHAVKSGLQPIHKGCEHYSTNLTQEQLQSIINNFVDGESQFNIAKHFNISSSAVSRIIYGVRYKEEDLDRSKVKIRPKDILSALTQLDIDNLWTIHDSNLSSIAKELNLGRKTVSNFFNKKGYTGKAGAPKIK